MELLRKSGRFVTNWLQDWTTMLIESEMICVAARLVRVGGLCDSRDVSQAPPVATNKISLLLGGPQAF